MLRMSTIEKQRTSNMSHNIVKVNILRNGQNFEFKILGDV